MKSVRLRFAPDDEQLHPMHEFAVDHEAFERTELHHWNPTVTGGSTIVLKVFGTDIEAYETALTETECVLSYELSQLPGGSFFIVADKRLNVTGTRQTATVTRSGLIAVPSVVFDGDGMVSMALAGTDEALQSAVERLLEGHGPEVVRVRECAGPGSVSVGSLSPRQREAVRAAVDCGCYHKSQTGAVTDVAARLDCSMSTAVEHLRKAGIKVVIGLVDRS